MSTVGNYTISRQIVISRLWFSTIENKGNLYQFSITYVGVFKKKKFKKCQENIYVLKWYVKIFPLMYRLIYGTYRT